MFELSGPQPKEINVYVVGGGGGALRPAFVIYFRYVHRDKEREREKIIKWRARGGKCDA